MSTAKAKPKPLTQLVEEIAWTRIRDARPPYSEQVLLADKDGEIAWGNRSHTDADGDHYVCEDNVPFLDVAHWARCFGPTSAGTREQNEELTARSGDVLARGRVAAVRTLENLGYTFHDGELWRPPLGPRPPIDPPAPERGGR